MTPALLILGTMFLSAYLIGERLKYCRETQTRAVEDVRTDGAA